MERTERSESLKQRRAHHMRWASYAFGFIKNKSASEVVGHSR